MLYKIVFIDPDPEIKVDTLTEFEDYFTDHAAAITFAEKWLEHGESYAIIPVTWKVLN